MGTLEEKLQKLIAENKAVIAESKAIIEYMNLSIIKTQKLIKVTARLIYDTKTNS